jgi:type II secretory pathway pseudopilin PulG
MKRRKRISFRITGWLLIDVLITITLISMLSLGTFLGINRQVVKAKDASMKADLHAMSVSLHEIYDDQNCFPKELPACGEPLEVNEKVYIPSIPCDVKGNPYLYEVENAECSTWFKLLVNLGNTKDPGIDTLHCREGCGSLCAHNYGVSSSNVPLNDGCPLPTPTAAPTATPTSTPIPTPTPTPGPKLYACGPPNVGRCIEYEDPFESGCPVVFANDPTCQNNCKKKEYQCKNEKGKAR